MKLLLATILAAVAAPLPGELVTPPPWPPNTQTLRARLEAMGLPALSSAGEVLHIHQHLDLFINGNQVIVPAGIGINVPQQFISPIHTHTSDGVIHIESPFKARFSLSALFGVWGVRFTQSCIGSLCAHGAKRLWVFANGQLVTFDPRKLELTSHEEIVVSFGTKAQLPNPIPKRFSFPRGF